MMVAMALRPRLITIAIVFGRREARERRTNRGRRIAAHSCRAVHYVVVFAQARRRMLRAIGAPATVRSDRPPQSQPCKSPAGKTMQSFRVHVQCEMRRWPTIRADPIRPASVGRCGAGATMAPLRGVFVGGPQLRRRRAARTGTRTRTRTRTRALRAAPSDTANRRGAHPAHRRTSPRLESAAPAVLVRR